jgi:hypothetical protein
MVIFFQNCSDLLWEKIVLMIEKKKSGRKFVQTVKSQYNFWNSMFFHLCQDISRIRRITIQIEKNNGDSETYRKSLETVWLKSHIILPEWLSLVILSHEPIVLWHVVWVLAFDWRRLWEPLILWLWSLSWVHAFYHGRQLLVGAIWRDFLEAEKMNLNRIGD